MLKGVANVLLPNHHKPTPNKFYGVGTHDHLTSVEMVIDRFQFIKSHPRKAQLHHNRIGK